MTPVSTLMRLLIHAEIALIPIGIHRSLKHLDGFRRRGIIIAVGEIVFGRYVSKSEESRGQFGNGVVLVCDAVCGTVGGVG
jgi:hypothetical protein